MVAKKDSEARYFETIIDKIREMILSGELQCGERLPSERELAEKFNVSRVPVREAVKILEYMGVLESGGGSGMYVKNLDIRDLITKLNFPFATTTKTIHDLMDFRCDLECTAAYYAAMRRTEEDIWAIRKTLEDMRAAKRAAPLDEERAQELRRLSHGFHRSVVRASKNSVLISVYESLFELLDISKQFTINVSGISYNSILAHEAILNKIVQRDGDGARSCMMEHMEATRLKLEDQLGERGDAGSPPPPKDGRKAI